jgi:hypothetical protein
MTKVEMGYWVRHGNHWHGVLLAMKPNGGTIRLGGYDQDGQPMKVATAFRALAEKRWKTAPPIAPRPDAAIPVVWIYPEKLSLWPSGNMSKGNLQRRFLRSTCYVPRCNASSPSPYL